MSMAKEGVAQLAEGRQPGNRSVTGRVLTPGLAVAYVVTITPAAVRWASTGSGHLRTDVLFSLPALASFIAGFILRRWWALSLPLIPFVYMVIRANVDSTAGFEEGWGFYLLALLVEEVALLAIAVAVSRRPLPS
jgi:hypothetical protein